MEPSSPGPSRSSTRPNWGIIFLLVAFAVVGLAYSLATPLFEAPDEDHHFFYVKHLADGLGLPVLDPANPGPWAQEGGQPPLYYALGALLIRGIATDGIETALKANPHANLGAPLQAGNKNRWLHPPDQGWPWRGWVWAAHLLRFGSLLLGLGSIYLVFRLTALLFPARPWLSLAAAALLAFLPQFIFVSASISNDNLIIFLSLLALLLLARGIRPGHHLGLGLAALLGFILGLAALAKLSGLGLLILTGVIWLGQGWRNRRWRQAATHLAIAGLVAGLVAGWWYLRNWRLYSDPTGLRPFLAIVGPRSQPLTLGNLTTEFQGLRLSLFALFGWFNLLFPAWVYRLWDAFLLLAAGGLLLGLWRRPRQSAPAAALLLPWLLISLASLWRWTSLTPGSQGRLLLPAFAAASPLLALGWSQLLPRRPAWAILPAAAALLASLLALPLVILPAYRPPTLIAADAIPAAARIDPVEIDGAISLLGLEAAPTTLHPGQTFDLTLYWQANRPLSDDASLFLRLLGPGYRVFGQWDSYPGWGAYPTSLWPVGPVIRDRYRLQAPWDAPAPTLLRLDAGLYDYETKTSYPSRRASGAQPPPGLLILRLLPANSPPTPAIPTPTAFTFADRIDLLGYDLTPGPHRPGQVLDLDLYWEATGPVGEDFQTFVHLLDAGGQQMAGHDAPAGGAWWPSSAWEPGQIVADHYPVPLPADLPAGTYTLIAGLYRLATLERIPVAGPPDATPHQAALLTQITITP